MHQGMEGVKCLLQGNIHTEPANSRNQTTIDAAEGPTPAAMKKAELAAAIHLGKSDKPLYWL